MSADKGPKKRVYAIYEGKSERPPKSREILIFNRAVDPRSQWRSSPTSTFRPHLLLQLLHAYVHGLLDVSGAVKGEGGYIGVVDRCARAWPNNRIQFPPDEENQGGHTLGVPVLDAPRVCALATTRGGGRARAAVEQGP